MDWLVAEFGRDILLRPIALPAEVIPDGYDGSRAAATEDYGGVPISDEELADVWQAPTATDDAGTDADSEKSESGN